MSDWDRTTVHSNSFIKGPQPQFKSKSDRPFWNGDALAFTSLPAARRIGELAERNGNFLSVLSNIELELPYPYNAEAKRFALALEGYRVSSNPVMNPYQIWSQSFLVGHKYASFVKHIRFKSMMISMGGLPLAEPDWFNTTPGYAISDIGQVFNYRYLFNWLEPEESQISDYCGVPLPEVDEDYILDFTECCIQVVNECNFGSAKTILKEEILCESSNSSCLSGLTNAQEKIFKPHVNYMGSKIGDTRSAWVQKCPGDSRNILVLSVPASNRVKWIDKQLMEVLKEHPMNAQVTDSDLFIKRFNRLKNKNYFLCRDLTKEGLSKPRWLLKVMLQVLYDYTELDAFEAVDFYEDLTIDGISYPRGHGLGMANSLTTLMQLTFLRMAMVTMGVRGLEMDDDLDALFFNDDCVIGFTNKDNIEEFIEDDAVAIQQCGHLRSEEKSFTSPNSFVLCETYYKMSAPSFSAKDSYYEYQALRPLYATDISHAKEISMGLHVPYEKLQNRINTYAFYWGYEFHPDEFQLPYILGGWGSNKMAGTSLDLFMVHNTAWQDIRTYKGFMAAKASAPYPKFLVEGAMKRMLKKGITHRFVHPYEAVLGLFSDEIKQLHQPTNLTELCENSVKFNRSPQAFVLWRERIKVARQKAYNNTMFMPLPGSLEILKRATKAYKMDFIPPESSWLSKTWIPGFYNGSWSKIYYPDHPRLASIAAVLERPVCNYIMPNPLILHNIRKWHSKIPDALGVQPSWKEFTIDYWEHKLSWPRLTANSIEGEDHPYRDLFLDPDAVTEVMWRICGEKDLPYFSKEVRSPFIEEKESICGRFLDLEEELSLAQYNGPLDPIVYGVKILDIDIDDDMIDELNEIVPTKLVKEKPKPPIDQDLMGDEYDMDYIAHKIAMLHSSVTGETVPVYVPAELPSLPRAPTPPVTIDQEYIDDQIRLWQLHARSNFAWGSYQGFGGHTTVHQTVTAWGADGSALSIPQVQSSLFDSLSLEAYYQIYKGTGLVNEVDIERQLEELDEAPFFDEDEGFY